MRNTKTNSPYIYIFIGFNNPKIHKRGVENIILLQSKALHGKKIFYVFFGPATKITKWGNIIVISIRKFDFLRLNLIFRFLKKKYKAQIFIHSHNYQLSFFCFWKTNVFTVHDGLTYLSKSFKRKYIYIYTFIEKVVYRRAKIIHFISEFSKREALINKKYDYKSVIIYNSTPLESLKQDSGVMNLPTKDGIDNIRIFSVRTIETRARIDLLVDVCVKLSEQQLPLTITVAGKGPLLKEYLEIIEQKKLSNLILLGYITDDELIKRYNECELVIVPSEYGEGFGLPIIEGYLFGKPVIASNKCAIPEVIIDRDMLFENNVDSICQKIYYFINNIESLTHQSTYCDYYDKRFSQIKIVSLYKEKLYAQLNDKES
jgi:glycosyltransferase involved in cell wall biosynthesis